MAHDDRGKTPTPEEKVTTPAEEAATPTEKATPPTEKATPPAGKATPPAEDAIFSIVLLTMAFSVLALALVVSVILPVPFFTTFVPLPGCIGVANYLITSRHRKAEHEGEEPKPSEAEVQHQPKLSEALAAALVLTAVFCVVNFAATSNSDDMEGLAHAGYGAYISTLWLMLVRLNASALSPRFLMNSALKVSIAMLIGFVASTNELFGSNSVMPSLCFFIGLFHSFALTALKRAAMATFGMTQLAGPADLSVRLLEGVDDGAADVLEELGITSVQHLATMRASEVCGRSLYPRDRVLDWMDQSILAVHTNGRIGELRAIGIRSAFALITVVLHASADCVGKIAATQRMQDAERRLGLADGGLQLLADCICSDPAYQSLSDEYGRQCQHVPSHKLHRRNGRRADSNAENESGR